MTQDTIGITPETCTAFRELLLQHDGHECRKIVDDLLRDKVPIVTLYRDLFEKALHQVGLLWEMNRISVADEHMCSAIVESCVQQAYPLLFSSERCGHRALVACPADEYHQLGAKMVADVFELHGWDGYFLGASTPVADLVNTLREKKVELLVLSLTVHHNMPRLNEAIEIVRKQHADLPIIVGGQAFRHAGDRPVSLDQGVQHLDTLDSLTEFLESY